MSSHRGDRTAKSVIRDEAMRLFAERGADAVTVRDIAAAASVSPALVMQHYGSKNGLRSAVDAHVLGLFERMITEATSTNPTSERESASLYQAAAGFFPAGSPIPGYLGRLLVSDNEAGSMLFRRLFTLARAGLDRMVDAGVADAGVNPDARAAFLLANDLAAIILHGRLRDMLGVDPLSPEGMAVWGREVLAVYAGGLGAPPVNVGKAQP